MRTVKNTIHISLTLLMLIFFSGCNTSSSNDSENLEQLFLGKTLYGYGTNGQGELVYSSHLFSREGLRFSSTSVSSQDKCVFGDTKSSTPYSIINDTLRISDSNYILNEYLDNKIELLLVDDPENSGREVIYYQNCGEIE